jgi:hypothetical protein
LAPIAVNLNGVINVRIADICLGTIIYFNWPTVQKHL